MSGVTGRPRVLLRVFLDEGDKHGGHPLGELLVLRAREAGLAGATLLRGPLGFGRGARLHTAKILRLADDLPLVLEIVDAEEPVRAFVAAEAALLSDCLVTLEKVTVLKPGS